MSWMQRITLIRNNLHAASRTGDFSFFKCLQATAFLEGTDPVAILAAALENEADQVLHGLDDLNVSIAYIHQDSYKNVYDNIRDSIGEEESNRTAKLRVDILQQKQIAEFGIAKMVNSTVALIQAQPEDAQEAVATVWIIGTTIVADAIQFCLAQIDKLETMLDDFILLESSWQMVQTAVEASVSALRGVFSLMASADSQNHRHMSISNGTVSDRSRTTSVGSATSSILKRLSTVLSHAVPPVPPPSNRNSVSFASPSALRNSISAACPTTMPALSEINTQNNQQQLLHHVRKRSAHDSSLFQATLSPIPPTPFGLNPDSNPFDTSFEQ